MCIREFWNNKKHRKISRCQFHQHYRHKFFIRTLFQQLFSSYMYVVKAAKKTFVQKICTFNVDEIDYRTCSNELSKANFIFRQKNMSFIENVSLFSLVRKCVSMSYLIQISFIYLDKFMKWVALSRSHSLILLMQLKVHSYQDSGKGFPVYTLLNFVFFDNFYIFPLSPTHKLLPWGKSKRKRQGRSIFSLLNTFTLQKRKTQFPA